MLGPLFYKELLEVSRRRRYYVARALVGIAMLAALWWGLNSVKPPITTANRAVIGRKIFVGWTLGVGVALFLVVPAVTAGLVAGEKDSRTLEVLLTTCLSDQEILIGKLASRLLWILTMLFACLPALGIASWYGGFSPADVLEVFLVESVAAIFMASLGLYYSTITQKPYVALIRTYLTLLLLEGILFYPVLSAPSSSGLHLFFYIVTHLPAAAVLFSWSHQRLRTSWIPTGDPWVVRIAQWIYDLVIGSVREFVEARKQTVGWSQLWRLEVASQRWGRLDYWLGGHLNPLIQRNASANVYDPQRYIAAVQIVVWVVALFWMMSLSQWTAEAAMRRAGESAMIPGALIILLLLFVLTASSFARERQYGSWEVLLLTNLTPRQFLFGTIIGVLHTLWPMMALFALVTAVIGYSVLLSEAMLFWLLIIVSILALLMMIFLINSLISQSINEALVRSLAIFVLLQAFGRAILPTIDQPFEGYIEATLAVGVGWLYFALSRLFIRGATYKPPDSLQLSSSSRRSGQKQLVSRLTLLTLLVPMTLALAAQLSLHCFGNEYFQKMARWREAPSYLDFWSWLGTLSSYSLEGHALLIVTLWTSTLALALVMLKYFNPIAGRN